MKSVLKVYLLVFIFFSFYSCGKNNRNVIQENENIFDSVQTDALTEIKYATGFNINYYSNYKVIDVINPWDGKNIIKFKYLLANKDYNPGNINIDAQIIEIPVNRIICLSTTHIAMLDLLGKSDKIVGVSGSRFVSNKNILKLLNEGKIKDVGYDQNLNYEQIIGLKPDLVIAYGIGTEASGFISRLKEFGIKVVINSEYLESVPLAKTEWIKFIAAFLDAEEIANEKFSNIEKEYLEILQLPKISEYKPRILTGLPWKNSWYVPGGDSYLARLIEDAGGSYLWEENNSRESLALDIESVFEKSQNANIWINPGAAISKEEILMVDNRLKGIKPFMEDRIYNNNVILNEYGGNDYWESGIVKPHVILKDLIYIFHPELLKDHKLVYFHKL